MRKIASLSVLAGIPVLCVMVPHGVLAGSSAGAFCGWFRDSYVPRAVGQGIKGERARAQRAISL